MTNELDTIRENVAKMTTEQLKAEFAEGLRLARERILRLAAILAELDARNQDVSGDKSLLKILRNIAAGKLLVDVVVRFAGRPYTLASIARLPVAKQQESLEEPDDRVVEEQFRRTPRNLPSSTPPRRPPVAGSAKSAEEEEIRYDPLKAMRAAGTRDLVDMLVNILRDRDDAVIVLEKVAAKLPKKRQTA